MLIVAMAQFIGAITLSSGTWGIWEAGVTAAGGSPSQVSSQSAERRGSWRGQRVMARLFLPGWARWTGDSCGVRPDLRGGQHRRTESPGEKGWEQAVPG